jgi:hypothetical protein
LRGAGQVGMGHAIITEEWASDFFCGVMGHSGFILIFVALLWCNCRWVYWGAVALLLQRIVGALFGAGPLPSIVFLCHVVGELCGIKS